MTTIIYHNSLCGTSRNTLELIRKTGTEPLIINYLETPPTAQALGKLIHDAGLTIRQAIREKEPLYTQLGLDNMTLDDAQLLDIMHNHPVLINRPFVVTNAGTRLCRPYETVLQILPESTD